MAGEKNSWEIPSDAKPVIGITTDTDGDVDDSVSWSCDPANPMNWSTLRKYALVTLISLTSYIASVCSTAFEPAIPIMMQEFHSASDSLSSITVTIYVLGYVFRPLLVAPLCELYGRATVLWPAYVLFMLTLLLCGRARSVVAFIVLRCIMGFAGNAFIIVGPAIVADIIPKHRLGLALSVISSGSIIGPTLGPIVGGLIVQHLSWRWIFWIALILFGALFLTSLFVLRETYAPVIRQRQQRHRSNPSSCFSLRSCRFSLSNLTTRKNSDNVLRAAFARPLKFLFLVPIVTLLALYTSVSYVFLQILFATLGTVFETRYEFLPEQSGLTYLGMTAGFVVALVTTGLGADRLAICFARKKAFKMDRDCTTTEDSAEGVVSPDKSKSCPEARLPLAVVGSVLIVPSILMYGFTLKSLVHWVVPLIATALIACFGVWTFMAGQMYLVDAYGTLAASATGAVSIFRAICASVVPLAANPAYDRYGYGWGNAIFAFACLSFVPMAVALMIWGERIRQRFQPEL